jgi:uncharacterized protein YcnI
MNRTLRTLAACAALAAAASVQAHVTLEYQVAPAGSNYKATFRVGHGCGASATKQVVVTLPAGVEKARPMPKPGWTVAIDGTRITWTAKTQGDVLASEHYDEFVLVARMPAQAGTLYWPVSQVCEEGRLDWTELPKPGQKLSDLKAPAAALEILPGGSAAGHHH